MTPAVLLCGVLYAVILLANRDGMIQNVGKEQSVAYLPYREHATIMRSLWETFWQGPVTLKVCLPFISTAFHRNYDSKEIACMIYLTVVIREDAFPQFSGRSQVLFRTKMKSGMR